MASVSSLLVAESLGFRERNLSTRELLKKESSLWGKGCKRDLLRLDFGSVSLAMVKGWITGLVGAAGVVSGGGDVLTRGEGGVGTTGGSGLGLMICGF